MVPLNFPRMARESSLEIFGYPFLIGGEEVLLVSCSKHFTMPKPKSSVFCPPGCHCWCHFQLKKKPSSWTQPLEQLQDRPFHFFPPLRWATPAAKKNRRTRFLVRISLICCQQFQNRENIWKYQPTGDFVCTQKKLGKEDSSVNDCHWAGFLDMTFQREVLHAGSDCPLQIFLLSLFFFLKLELHVPV